MVAEASSQPYEYPARATRASTCIYKYGGSYFGTHDRHPTGWSRTYRHDSSSSSSTRASGMEGETQFADVILPACTNFERWDIGEWGSTAAATCSTASTAVQSPRRRPAAQVHRAAGRVEVRLPDLPRAAAPGARRHVRRRVQRARLGASAYSTPPTCRRMSAGRSSAARATTWCPPTPRPCATPVNLPLVRRGAHEGHHRAAAAARRTTPRSSAWGCRPSRQAGVRSRRTSSASTRTTRSARREPLPCRRGRARTPRAVATLPAAADRPHSRYSFHTQRDGKHASRTTSRDHRVARRRPLLLGRRG